MFLKVILYANQVHIHSSGSNGNRNSNNSRHSVFFELMPIIAHPLLVLSENVGIFFAINKVIVLIGIKTWRAVFASLGVVLGTINTYNTTLIPTLISPAAGHITTVNEFFGK
jgi:hypothetical protein